MVAISTGTANPPSPTLDPDEVARFAALAEEWWDPHGKFRPLHKLGPARLGYIRDCLVDHFRISDRGLRPLVGRTVLDIGCGGGLICEPMARLGATVTGIDPAEANIGAARRHAQSQGLTIDYRPVRVEDLAAEGRTFDAVLCLEVVEHVPDVAAFLRLCAGLVHPGGILIASTINRTLKAYALAIVGAEYILRWLPVGTHQWERFVTPGELGRYLRSAGLSQPSFTGLVYNPLRDAWSLDDDTDVNYFARAAKPGDA